MAKMAASMMASGEDVFRKMFKFYKRRVPASEQRDVTDFSSVSPGENVSPLVLDCAAVPDVQAATVGLKPVREWRAFTLQSCPGFIFISNPFLPGCQAFWLTQCLKTYPQKPNICNLDMHMAPSDTQDIWGQSATSLRRASSGRREAKTLLERLRWVTLGYHYNWDTKTYSSGSFTPFPADLHLLSMNISAACGFPQFSSEAGILNYYRMDLLWGSTWMNQSWITLHHCSPSVLDSRPSSSWGACADRPRRLPCSCTAGDVMVMSGQSRLCFHAVPRILAPPQGRTALEEEGPAPVGAALPGSAVVGSVCEEGLAVCSRYIQSSRVNVTVRQVLGPGQRLPDLSPPTEDGQGRTEMHRAQRQSVCSDIYILLM
uniref:Alpha-ketoglutarate-dependent dioxygenase AlkB-like domain-containing protein n=1 Tax=Gouania willdenowi TaxID=441366 RepID=A0A8C5DKZ5_GOUWI